jgi:hypothetical protein
VSKVTFQRPNYSTVAKNVKLEFFTGEHRGYNGQEHVELLAMDLKSIVPSTRGFGFANPNRAGF